MQTKYMLRRTLCPWNVDGIVEETVKWCVEQRIDEIMWITESSGMYKELLPIEEIEKIVDWLHRTRERTEAAGILYSLNPLTTIGHGDAGHDIAAIHPGVERMVDFTGSVSKACCCPLSPVWRELMRKTFAAYATTRPVRIWLEDDFRYINHGPRIRYGCYCRRHLEAFSERIGETVDRERLVASMLAPGKPHPWREWWHDFLAETLLDTATMLQKAVKDISPETEIGFMASGPLAHELEGRRVPEEMNALAGDGTAAIRISMSPRNESGHREMLMEDEGIKKMLPNLGGNITLCTELESHPHSAYAVSAARLGAQMEWAGILGVPNHTMNIYDYIGTPLAEEPAYDDMLRERKDEFTAFAESFAGLNSPRGVGIPYDMGGARKVHTPEGKDMRELLIGESGWTDTMRAFGMPIHYSKEESVSAMTGRGLWCLSDDELTDIFSRGVLLDLSALETLREMGRLDLAGVSIAGVYGLRERPTGPEELTDPEFAGGKHHFNWTYGIDKIASFLPADGARPISRILNADGEFLYHGIVLYENTLGGRVASVPFYCEARLIERKGPPQAFYTPYRRQQFQALLPWLRGESEPLVVKAGGWILPHRGDSSDRIGIAAMNLNSDSWKSLEISCTAEKSVKNIDWLDIDGKRGKLPAENWRQDGGDVSIKIDTLVPPLRTVAFVLDI